MIRPAATSSSPTVGASIRRARLARGWSQDVLARRVAEARRAGGESIDPASVKTQLSRWENGRVVPDRLTRQILADAFSTTVEALFGLQPADDLPRPVLLEAHVTTHTVELLRARRAVHAQTEASFGPAEASALVSHDLATIDGLLRVAPKRLSAELHEVAAMIAELGGWIAQDSGDVDQALVCTSRAYAHAQAAENPRLEAMILMRWANVVASWDPRMSATLSQRADQLASALPPSRLHAAIARQRANVAAVLGDRAMFDAQVERARDYAAAPVTEGELTPYADRAYIASEQADGLLVLAEPERAAATLAEHVHTWAAGQERDHAVALARWLHALAASGDCRTALDHSEYAHWPTGAPPPSAPARRSTPSSGCGPSGTGCTTLRFGAESRPRSKGPQADDSDRAFQRHDGSRGHRRPPGRAPHRIVRTTRPTPSPGDRHPHRSRHRRRHHRPVRRPPASPGDVFLLPRARRLRRDGQPERRHPGGHRRRRRQSLERQGIRRLLIVNGHGGNYVLHNLAQQSALQAGIRIGLFPTREDWAEAREAAGMASDSHQDMHAGELEVSILLAAFPDVVREGWEHDDHEADDRRHLSVLGMSAYTKTGVIGRPSLASPEKGRAALDHLVGAAQHLLKILDETSNQG
jgi:transcriptional regulator with XRE-family HTH domain